MKHRKTLPANQTKRRTFKNDDGNLSILVARLHIVRECTAASNSAKTAAEEVEQIVADSNKSTESHSHPRDANESRGAMKGVLIHEGLEPSRLPTKRLVLSKLTPLGLVPARSWGRALGHP